MNHGIPVGMEVGGPPTVRDVELLADTYRKTGVFCMTLQNCNYGHNELALLNMVKQGKFGELVHLQCGYEHDIRQEIAEGFEKRHYRLANFLNRNCDNYPHHGLGPMMKLLKIGRGNRFVSLTSMSSKAAGLKAWAKDHLPPEHHIHDRTVNQGDVVNTIIKCANGETVLMTLDNTLPRPYSRGGRVQGTRGLWTEDNGSIYIEGESPEHQWEPFYDYVAKNDLEHPLWKIDEREDRKAKGNEGHGGMDFLLMRAFIEDGLGKGLPPFDTMDTLALAVISPLTEQSILLGGSAVAIPDFTSGAWMTPGPVTETKYSLNI